MKLNENDYSKLEYPIAWGKCDRKEDRVNILEVAHPDEWADLEEDDLESVGTILADAFADSWAGTCGDRNDHAVNISVALWCLGYEHPWDEVVYSVALQAGLTPTEIALWADHFARVEDYLPSWGVLGDSDALKYALV